MDEIKRIESGIRFDGTNHTVVQFTNNSYACSCGDSSEVGRGFFYKSLPNLRLEQAKCVVCSNLTHYKESLLDNEPMCEFCIRDFCDWYKVHPDIPAMEYLHMKITDAAIDNYFERQ
jgi:hypothetical protein